MRALGLVEFGLWSLPLAKDLPRPGGGRARDTAELRIQDDGFSPLGLAVEKLGLRYGDAAISSMHIAWAQT